MKWAASRAVRLGGIVAVSLLAAAVLTPAANAAPGAVKQLTAANVTADVLPTVQINGVAWSQAVVGNTVYVAGSFTNARPAGAKPGTHLTTRKNLLAYNLTTGALITSFAPSLNGQARVVTASPDGSRIYVGGDFTYADGSIRYHLAAYSTKTGKLVSNFKPKLDHPVLSIAVSATSVYIGGDFAKVNGVARSRLAALCVNGGALRPWAPKANSTVTAMVLTPNKSRLIIGGRFTNISSKANFGMASLSAHTGGVLAWAATKTVRDAGKGSAILSLTTDGASIYGTGYNYFGAGNFEGTFKADATTGKIIWLEDCHGDTYSNFVSNGVVYVVGHAHYCSNIGGFPQTASNTYHRTLAFSANATGTLLHNTAARTADFSGQPSPSLQNWFPELTAGTYTGQSQAAWSVTGNSKYVVEGGEFTAVNGVAQQGLVRFTTRAIAPDKQGPMASGSQLVATAAATSDTTAKVSWTADWDRDDANLTYTISRREGDSAAVIVGTVTAASEFWNRPTLSLVDTGLMAGHTYRYRVTATDPTGNAAVGDPASVTLPVTPVS